MSTYEFQSSKQRTTVYKPPLQPHRIHIRELHQLFNFVVQQVYIYGHTQCADNLVFSLKLLHPYKLALFMNAIWPQQERGGSGQNPLGPVPSQSLERQPPPALPWGAVRAALPSSAVGHRAPALATSRLFHP